MAKKRKKGGAKPAVKAAEPAAPSAEPAAPSAEPAAPAKTAAPVAPATTAAPAKTAATAAPAKTAATAATAAPAKTAAPVASATTAAPAKTAAPATAAAATKAPTRVETTSPPRRDEPAFWFGFEVSWAKLALGRFVLFGLLALDALMQIRHAPRYSAGGFNVAQIPLLDGFGPTRASYAVCELINAWLFTLAALGVATRWVVPPAAAIYAWLYFGSQLDSYQHHYLVSLVLLCACFVPWQRPRDATPTTRVATWALRLILVELAIMYLWAAISKMNAAWVDGRTLSTQIIGPMRHLVDGTVGVPLASKLVIVVELTLAALVWQPRFWMIAAPLGIVFHVGILFSGLEIGLFAWLMIAIYMFVVPDRVWTTLATSGPIATVRNTFAIFARRVDGSAGWFVWMLGATLGTVFAMLARFEYAGRIGLLALVAMIAGSGYAIVRAPQARRLTAIGVAHLAAMTLWLATDRASTVAIDYYRFWGGTSRRLGDLAMAERAYRELVDVAPDEPAGHFQLGRMLLAQQKPDEALTQLHAAQRLSPSDARPFVLEARWLAGHGRGPDAVAKAREATLADPNDKDARDLLDSLTRGGPPPAETSSESNR